MLELLHHFCGRDSFVPLDDDPFPFGTPATGPYIGQSRATQGKGLRMDDRFFPYLEGVQVESAIGGQVLRECLIESHAPILKCAQLKEAPRHLLKCSWCTRRVPQYNRDIIRQSVAHQSFTIGGQETQVLRSQAKERERMTAIAAD